MSSGASGDMREGSAPRVAVKVVAGESESVAPWARAASPAALRRLPREVGRRVVEREVARAMRLST